MFGIYSRVRRGLDRWFRASVPSNLVAPMSIGAQSRAPELAPLPVSEPAAVEEYWMCITALADRNRFGRSRALFGCLASFARSASDFI